MRIVSQDLQSTSSLVKKRSFLNELRRTGITSVAALHLPCQLRKNSCIAGEVMSGHSIRHHASAAEFMNSWSPILLQHKIPLNEALSLSDRN
jgi:hypothetical protein